MATDSDALLDGAKEQQARLYAGSVRTQVLPLPPDCPWEGAYEGLASDCESESEDEEEDDED